MYNCKTLLYHPDRQEAITPVHANRLLKWDVADVPTLIAQQQVAFHWAILPQAVALPDRDQFAIAYSGRQQSYIELYRWSDLTQIERIAVPHAADAAGDEADTVSTHPRCSELSDLRVTPCGRYLAVVEGEGDIHLLHLDHRSWTRLKRREFGDYTERVIFDPALRWAVVAYVVTDIFYDFYRIDDLAADRLTRLGEFANGVLCHREQLQFHPQANAILRTGYPWLIDYYSFDADRLAQAAAVPFGSRSDEPPCLTRRWTQRLPYPLHPHNQIHPWQSSLDFQGDRLWVGAGPAIVQINPIDGAVLAEYHFADEGGAIVQAIRVDAASQRVIVATDRGIQSVAWDAFDPTMAYLRSLQAAHQKIASPAVLPSPVAAAMPDQSNQPQPQQYQPQQYQPNQNNSRPARLLGCLAGLLGLIGLGVFSGWGFLLISALDPAKFTPIVDRSYSAGDYQIREKIYRRSNGWTDPRYERVYVLQSSNKNIELGRFENEDDQGIDQTIAAPETVGEWIVVYSANRTLLWQSGRSPIEFEPFRAANWDEIGSQKMGINGHYDYYARDFWIEGDRWWFEYICATQPCLGNAARPLPETLRFFSDDHGQTFYLQADSGSGASNTEP